MGSKIKTLFLHNLNPANIEITKQNYNSFIFNNNDIEGILDEDLEGLENSFKVPINKPHLIPRGNRRWNPEIVFLNYFLENENNLFHDYYLFCEWDCFTKVNLDLFFQDYIDNYDVISPHVMTYNEDPNWQWFRSLDFPKEKLIGFRPSVFILFSKKAVLDIAYFYRNNWSKIQNSNSEALLGSVSNLLNLKIKNLSESIKLYNGISWFECSFKQENNILHPVKFLFKDNKFAYIPSPEEDEDIGEWEFGRTGYNNNFEILMNIKLNLDGTISGGLHYNETFWSKSNSNIYFYNYQGGLTTLFKKINDNFYAGDFYDGQFFSNAKLTNKNFHFLRKINY